MKSNLKKIKDCKVLLEVEVEPDLVERRFQSVLKEFQKSAALPGFREGKAPLDLVEKKFVKEAEEEVLKTLIPEAYHQSVATHKVAPVTLPSISEIKLERGKKLTFQAEFEKAPEIQVKNYKGLKIKKISAEVKPDEIEKGIQSLLEAKAELLPEKKCPDLDDAFAQGFGKSSVEELREAVRKDVASYKAQESVSKMREELFEKLLSLSSFSVPERLVERQKQHLMDQLRSQFHRRGLPESQLDSEKNRLEADAQTRAHRQVQLYFVLQKISELEGIEGDEMEVERRLQALVEQSKQPIEEVRHTFEEDIRDSLREAKTVEFLLANAKLEEVS